MEKNVGSTDRTIRIVLGIVLLVVAFMAKGVLGWILGILGVVMLVTAAISRCPLYLPFHINTCKK